MSEFICKKCGAPLAVSEGVTVCECSYCGSRQTVSGHPDAIRVNMFNRAANLRLKSEFDKAYAQYEQIVLNYPDDAEAYWGLLLCRFGVEYVKDPATGKMIPTLHRTQVQAVSTDPDYLSAIEHADASQRLVYEQEAGEIDRVQKEVMAVVQKESPYDVFICYKETDENGARTQDSVIANDIYHQLTQEGLKVFYAAITLEDKLGHEYEPYIYAALHSAKVMLVIGTRPEYFESVWVRNEWSRFLKLAEEDRSKQLIPCYRDMNPFDLPEEFSLLQAQDMSAIGFMSDIIRGTCKVLNIQTGNKSISSAEADDQESGYNESIVENLLKRGNFALEDRDWKEAEKLFNDTLDEYYKEYRAYIGLLCAENKAAGEAKLADVGGGIRESVNYRRACRFGGEKIKEKLDAYVTQYEYNQKVNRYNEAMEKMRNAVTDEDFQTSAELFGSLSGFKDSAQKADECINLGKKAYWDRIRNCKPGDLINFGPYKWIVLKENNNEKTLFCKELVARREYHSVYEKITWETCELRKWLNEEFYNRFSEEEKKVICKTLIETPKNREYHKKGGRPTEDYVFLLSIQEVQSIAPELLAVGKPWWLRSPGAGQSYAAAVNSTGNIRTDGAEVFREYLRVRPALNIKV